VGLGRNYLFNLSVTVGNVLFPVITLPIVLRVLGPEKFGEAQYILSLSIYFAVFAAVGVPLYGMSQVAKASKSENLDKVCSELIFIQLFAGIISVFAYSFSIILIPDIGNKFLLAFIASPIILASFLNVDWYFTGLQDFKIIAKRALYIKICSTLFILFLPISKLPVVYYVSIITFSYVGNYIFNFYIFFKKQKIVFINLEFKKHIPHLISIQITLLAGMIYTTLDSVFIGIFSTSEEIGIYTVGSKIIKLINPVIVSLGGILIPKIAFESLNQNNDQLKKVLDFSYNFIIYFSIPITTTLILLNTEIIILFAGTEYIKSTIILLILSSLPLIIGLGHLFSYQILIPTNKSFGTTVAAISGGIVFSVICFLLIPSHGSIGCAYAVLATEIIVTLIYLIFVPKVYYSLFKLMPILKAILSSSIFFPIFYLIQSLEINYFASLIANSLLYVISYVSIQHFVFKNRLILSTLTKL